MAASRKHNLLLSALLLLIAGCSGGSGGSGPTVIVDPPPPPPPPGPSLTTVSLRSDVGDVIGGGESFAYDLSDAVIEIVILSKHIIVEVEGDESWRGDFGFPHTYDKIEVGTYENLTLYGSHDYAVGGLSWTGGGRSCESVSGRITVNAVQYDGTTLEAIDFEFEQYCDGHSVALHGDITFSVDDTTTPPGPVLPAPDGLWAPAAGTVPDTGNYVYLESESGDFVGGGAQYLYTGGSAFFTLSGAHRRLSVTVESSERWWGDFEAMNVLTRLQPGYFQDLRRYPVHNPAKGGLNWTGEGRGCDAVTGWFVIDSVAYEQNSMVAVELRFAQRCDGAGPALYGAIRWDASDTTTPTGPIYPPPTGLWAPDPGITPDSGTFAYIRSEVGDYIGQGGVYLYTQADAIFSVTASDAQLELQLDGDEHWTSGFAGMDSLSRLEVGYYGGLDEFPIHNPAIGGLSWFGEGRGCRSPEGWFVIDSVTYDGPELIAIEMRFEQRCDSGLPSLFGEIHWDANDPTIPPGPLDPPPVGIWEPAPGITPASGTYIYLESQPGDFVGQGYSYFYNQADSLLMFDNQQASLDIEVDGDEKWRGNFDVMSSIARLEPGFYGDLLRYPFNNPAKGGLDWYGEGRGCNRLDGWFLVDDVAYNGDVIEFIELRFEQNCEHFMPPLRGAMRWDASDTASPPGPTVPIPGDLWAPADGITPVMGNYAYFESEAGDFVGGGKDHLYTDDNSLIDVFAQGSLMKLTVDGEGDGQWWGDFEPMDQLQRLEVGYYPDLRRYPFHNPVKGGLNMAGFYRGCNVLNGWFVVDYVSYEDAELTGIDLRLEQHCEYVQPALYGEIHWRR